MIHDEVYELDFPFMSLVHDAEFESDFFTQLTHSSNGVSSMLTETSHLLENLEKFKYFA